MQKILAFLASILPFTASTKELVGDAGFYDKSYVGKPMANGRPYNPSAMTIACNDPSIPLGSAVYIEYIDLRGVKRYAHATVTDRGPAEWLRIQKNRRFDFSYQLFFKFEHPNVGVLKNVKITVLEGAPK